MLAAGLLIGSMAQAVNLSWSYALNGDSTFTNVMANGGIGSASATLVAVVSWNDAWTTSSGALMMLSGNGITPVGNASSKTWLETNKNGSPLFFLYGRDAANSVVPTQGETYVFTLTRQSSDSGSYDFTLAMNGITIDTWTATSDTVNIQTWESGKAWDFTGDIALYDGALTQAEIDLIKTRKDTTCVPEPTVLALLALGVAGVALRRRA